MAAINMKELVRLEAEHNLAEDGLSYQQRCSRMAAKLKGIPWAPSPSGEIKRGNIEQGSPLTMADALKNHPLYGRRLIITPLMVPDKDRNIYVEEPIGHEIQVVEVQAGESLFGAADDVDRMVGDYKIVAQNPNKTITAKTTLPKIGQEISWNFATEICPVVRGNDGQQGYVWSLPTHLRQYGDCVVQIRGLSSLITDIAPELLPKFSGKPVMSYIDGLVLAASIPMTTAILKEFRIKEMQNAKILGLG